MKIWAEVSYYEGDNPSHLTNLKDNEKVILTQEYVNTNLVCANSFDEVIKVTKRDKKDGTKGMLSIFNELTFQPFTISYQKKSSVQLTEEQKADFNELGVKVNLTEERVMVAKKVKSYPDGSYLVYDFEKKENRTITLNDINYLIVNNKKYTY